MSTTTTIRKLCGGLVLVLVAGGALVGCGDSGPRATPLPPGADVTLVDGTTPTTGPVIEGEGASTTLPGTEQGTATTRPVRSTSTGDADRDLDEIESDLRQLDQDLSRSSLSEEGAVQ